MAARCRSSSSTTGRNGWNGKHWCSDRRVRSPSRHFPAPRWTLLRDLREVLDHDGIDLLLVHCFAGASRSPAVAEVLAGLYGVSIADTCYPRDARFKVTPNKHVYDTMARVASRV